MRTFAPEMTKSVILPYKAALFDLDGVVFDTEPQYTVFWGEQCRLYRPDIPDLEHKIKGQTLTQIYDKWFSGPLESEQQVITARLNAYEAQMSYDYVPGFLDFIKSIREQGLLTAVVTSSNVTKMNAVCAQRSEFKSLFDAILTSEDFAESKPSPDCYLKAAARFDLVPSECVVFEDSFNGLRSGRAAQMKVVGLSTTNDASQIQNLCDIVIPNYLGFQLEQI